MNIKMKINNILPYTALITVWIANVNDLIRGEWFYHSIEGIITANIVGVLGLILIIIDAKERVKKK